MNSVLQGHSLSRPGHRAPSACLCHQIPHTGASARHTLGSSFLQGGRLQSHQQVARAASCRRTVRVEANLFSRFFRVIRSYGNSFVSGAEDPEKVLDQAVNEMQNDLIKMRQAAAQVLASQKQIDAKYDSALDTAKAWQRRAELAVQKGDDELAREALRRRATYQANADAMKKQVDAQKKATEQLVSNTRMLEQKLTEAKSKKDTLKARAKTANSSKQINEMIQGLNTSSAMSAFERMEEKVMSLEAETEATLQLAATDEVEGKFQQLESGGDVDDELAAMKKGMLGSGSSSSSSSSSRDRSLPEGRPIRDAIDFELEELRRKARN
ncbi:hypothetical protein WJX73_006403 [Symbiochloris irregularis]|uniref:Uncharacterized protein n=1 Tax=Symbiochloris irregularis TaxID=706552 RepID=A0AAW1NRM6_9CHLO